MKIKHKTFFVILSLICLSAFSQNKKSQTGETWIENFRQFRTALYQGNKTDAKKFFKFPIISGDEIWYLAYQDSNEAIVGTMAENKPFTEKDFERHFAKIFPKPLIQCLLKIKTQKLADSGTAESPEIVVGQTTYKLYVTLNKKEKILELNLATTYPIEDTHERGETNYIYRFLVVNESKIVFQKILIAG